MSEHLMVLNIHDNQTFVITMIIYFVDKKGEERPGPRDRRLNR